MAFTILNLGVFKRKMKVMQRASNDLQKDLSKEIPIDYIFVLARNTPMAPARDDEGNKIRGRGLAKAAWYQMLPKFGKKSSTSRRIPPDSSVVTSRKRRSRTNIVLINAIDYIYYLDQGGRSTPPSNILKKSEIEMKRKAEKRLKKTGKALKKIWMK